MTVRDGELLTLLNERIGRDVRPYYGPLWLDTDKERAELEVQQMETFTRAILCGYRGHLVWVEDIESHLGVRWKFAYVASPHHPRISPAAYLLLPRLRPNLDLHLFDTNQLCLSSIWGQESRSVLVVRSWAALWAQHVELKADSNRAIAQEV